MYTLRIDCNQASVDENNEETGQSSYTITTEYSTPFTMKQSFADSTGWRDILLPTGINNFTFVKILSDQYIDVRLNNIQVLTNLKSLILNADVNQIQIKNYSGETATVEVEVYA